MNYVFGFFDYASLICMLIISVLIGGYYGIFEKQRSQTDYLFGGKQMHIWPISLSLVSSIISAIPLITFPAEIYRYGIHLALVTPLLILVSLLTYNIYLPIFYKLQVTSTYEYLKLRFSNRVRIFASIIYTIFMVIHLPFVIYVPGLAISQVTGINLHYITPIVCGICIFYTTLGGLKAVVWTDAVQFVVMLCSMLLILALGISESRGLGNIWKVNYRGKRFDIDFDVNLTKRDSFWTGTVSSIATFTSLISVNQSVVQKCMALPTFKKVKHAMIIFTIGFILLNLCCFLSGFVIYAKYHNCDPLLSGQISHKDQIVPYFVLDVAGVIPGLPGIFISGILSAGLSTLSASLNCLAATVYEDFISPFLPNAIQQKYVSLILRSIVVIFGVICTTLVFAVEQMGSILPMSYSALSITGGPLLGVFTIGILFPNVNTKGAIAGGIAALLVMAWITLKTQFYQIKKIFTYPELPVSTDNCTNTHITLMNNTQTSKTIPLEEDIFGLYKISHFHYTLISLVTVIVVSVAVSYITKRKEEQVDRNCIHPLVHFLLPKGDSQIHIPMEQATLLSYKGTEKSIL